MIAAREILEPFQAFDPQMHPICKPPSLVADKVNFRLWNQQFLCLILQDPQQRLFQVEFQQNLRSICSCQSSDFGKPTKHTRYLKWHSYRWLLHCCPALSCVAGILCEVGGSAHYNPHTSLDVGEHRDLNS